MRLIASFVFMSVLVLVLWYCHCIQTPIPQLSDYYYYDYYSNAQ